MQNGRLLALSLVGTLQQDFVEWQRGKNAQKQQLQLQQQQQHQHQQSQQHEQQHNQQQQQLVYITHPVYNG